MFDLHRIESETFVERIEYHPEIGSTNDRALELAAAGDTATPLLVLAAKQTAGRGRGGNPWWSAAGSLTCSLLLTDHVESLPSQAVPQLALTTGLAVCQALQELTPELDFGLKWPNDVYIAGQHKLCGILIEVPQAASRTAVLGIGINVNNSFRDAPVELRRQATSLTDATGKELEISSIVVAVLQRLESLLKLLITDPAELQRQWRRRCILTGRSVRVATGRAEIQGICQGIDRQGSLLIATAEGLRACASGVVQNFV